MHKMLMFKSWVVACIKPIKRPLYLSMSLVLLSLTVLFMSDLAGLKFSSHEASKESRKAIVEALALQLSALAEKERLEDAQVSISRVVLGNENVHAASLVRSTGVVLASVGDPGLLSNGRFFPGSSQFRVPLYADGEPWGEVRVVFEPLVNRYQQLLAAAVVAVCLLLTFTAFLHRALVQLDPRKAVPGRVDSAMDLFSAGVIVLDSRLRIVMVNQAAEKLVGRDGESLMGYKLDEWPWYRDAEWEAPWESTLETGQSVSDHPMALVSGEGKQQSLLVSCVFVGDHDGEYKGVLITLDDITTVENQNKELTRLVGRLRESQDLIKQKNAELEELATTDALSKVANRRALMEFLQSAVENALEDSGEVACIMTDIDHFKSVNDTYGHKVGDDVIRACAGVLRGLCEDGCLVGRYGGEEFVMVLPGRSAKDAAAIAERARIAVMALAYGDTLPVDRLSASYGVADLTCGAQSGADIVDVADQCLYVAKQHGRNRVVMFGSELAEGGMESEPSSTINYGVNADKESDIAQARIIELEGLLERREQELSRLGEYDALTGMPLRSVFLQRAAVELERSVQNETLVGVISFEFKGIESLLATFGYSRCEQLFTEVLERLQEDLENTSIVSMLSAEHSLSRIASNEYAVLLTSLSDMTSAMIAVARMKRVLAKPFQLSSDKVYIGASLGIAISAESGDVADSLLSEANKARNAASLKSEKFSHAFAATRLRAESNDYFRLEADLHDALQTDAIETWFQPKLDLEEDSIVGMEALLRWNHPERGFVSPELFVAVAEANGLIDVLSKRVLTATLQQIVIWRSMGFDKLRVSINISPLQLRAETLVRDTLKALEDAGVGGSQLEIELTETSVLENPEQARKELGTLRETGVSVSLDDFGTGYTSLSLLSELPLDVVKIDKSFIDAVTTSARASAIVGSVINMAHALNLRVVAEGVETEEQVSELRRLGCDEVQGYWVCRPAPASTVTAFLVSKASGKKAA